MRNPTAKTQQAVVAGPESQLGTCENPLDQKAFGVIDDLLKTRQVILVTGKGGVGKSVISNFLALRAKSLGLLPLLFECDCPPRPSLLPGGKDTSNDLREVFPGILAINQDSDEAVKEYANTALPSKMLAELLIENRISRLFLRASPSVNEMALVGRMMQLADQHGKRGPVIVDLHSTGHALTMLRTPDGIMKVLRTGPVYERAQHVHSFLFDHTRTSIITVAHPEELPVTELLEFIDALAQMNAPLGPVVINGVFSDPSPELTEGFLQHLHHHLPQAQERIQNVLGLRHWAQRCVREKLRLETSLKAYNLPHISLPFLVTLPPQKTLASALLHYISDQPDTPSP